MTVLIVSGTGTGVGKTVATAAIAACAPGRVAVVKPAQTGPDVGGPPDIDEVTRLSGVAAVHEFARYPDPLSPHHAARISGLPELAFADAVRRITDLDALHDLVLVEGAGGLLVPYTSGDRWTMADLAGALRAPVLVVVAAGLGTLNHTALTVGRLAEDALTLAGIVIGSWPNEPDLAARCNVSDLATMGELAGALPAGMAAMRDFRRHARAALTPRFGGTFDAAAFLAAVANS
ncbi:MAG: dethiobiotin synthetase [Pseudonocardiales bacterium]|jgi:dethiobiotin synthetase|nr:dethiobiotin synthetase [Pseudonocardiales bacterium]MDT4919898.1 dethiobiotin synthetase [Pseudonocardiales bacterium]MDT4942711.1 dethiobiotin synthetase [Pseudonocardiales bacterium]